MSETTLKNIASVIEVVGQRAGGVRTRNSMFAVAANYVFEV